ncbi:MAG: nucleoside deaminase [Planctomycetota bacterium]|nr:nucleoside deaminase [Planctomycetota bacterium]
MPQVDVSWLDDNQDIPQMQLALQEARSASEDGEVPVGAVIWHPERGVIARARNSKETLRDPTAHAEILALGQAAQALDGWRLEGCTLYCTLEPCPMCAGAILQARIDRVVFGASDSRWGAVETKLGVFQPGLFNHDVSWVGGVLAEESADLLRSFFRECRRLADGKKDES